MAEAPQPGRRSGVYWHSGLEEHGSRNQAILTWLESKLSRVQEPWGGVLWIFLHLIPVIMINAGDSQASWV